jgi:hypothetical protein
LRVITEPFYDPQIIQALTKFSSLQTLSTMSTPMMVPKEEVDVCMCLLDIAYAKIDLLEAANAVLKTEVAILKTEVANLTPEKRTTSELNEKYKVSDLEDILPYLIKHGATDFDEGLRSACCSGHL